MKKRLSILVIGLLVLGSAGLVYSNEKVIGQASCNGEDYSLVLDDNKKAESVMTLVPQNENLSHDNSTVSPAKMACSLNINLDPGYEIVKQDASWLLSDSVNGP